MCARSLTHLVLAEPPAGAVARSALGEQHRVEARVHGAPLEADLPATRCPSPRPLHQISLALSSRLPCLGSFLAILSLSVFARTSVQCHIQCLLCASHTLLSLILPIAIQHSHPRLPACFSPCVTYQPFLLA